MGALLNQIKNPGSTNSTGSRSSLLNSIIRPKNQERANKIQRLQQEADLATQEAKRANSFGGLIKETFKPKNLAESAGITDILHEIRNDIFNVKNNTLPKAPKSAVSFLLSPTSINNPERFLYAGIDVFKESWQAEKEAFNKILYTKPGTTARGGAVASTLARTAGLALSPISALFAATETVPAIGTAIKLMDAAFVTFGTGGANISNKVIDSLPISDESKSNLKPGFAEIASLASQIILGKAGDIGAHRFVTSLKPTVPETVIRVKSTTGENVIPVNTPATRYAAYLKSQGYEPYINPDALPVIQIGTKGKSNLPTIDFDKSGNVRSKNVKVPDGFKYEPIEELTKKYGAEDAQVIIDKANDIAGRVTRSSEPTTSGRLIDRIIKPETSGVSRTSIKTIERAQEAGLIKEPVKLPEIKNMELEVQAERARAFIETNLDEAIQQVTDVKLPEIYKGAIRTALENKAIAEGNVDLIFKLAKSELGTELGQALKALDAGVETLLSPAKLLKLIQQAREESPTVTGILRTGNLKKAKVEVKQKITTEIRKATEVKPKTWDEFINNLEC